MLFLQKNILMAAVILITIILVNMINKNNTTINLMEKGNHLTNLLKAHLTKKA
jgi:hypothetical protein